MGKVISLNAYRVEKEFKERLKKLSEDQIIEIEYINANPIILEASLQALEILQQEIDDNENKE